jgi:hypothetical protein
VRRLFTEYVLRNESKPDTLLFFMTMSGSPVSPVSPAFPAFHMFSTISVAPVAPEPSAPLDSVVQSVISKFVRRAEMGKKKYGVDLDRTDLSVLDWIQHAQEEHMDAILYLEKLKKTLQG